MYAGIDPKDPVDITYFKSTSKARAFLIKNSDLLETDDDGVTDLDRLSDDIPEEKLLKKKLEDAKKVIDHADKRNLRRQVQSLNGRGKAKSKRPLAAEQILDYDKIVQQLSRLSIPMSRFASWCGIDDHATIDNLHAIGCKILSKKCPEGAKLLLWDDEGCADGDQCARPRQVASPHRAEPQPARIPNWRQRANPLLAYPPEQERPRPKRSRVTRPARVETIRGLADLHRWEEVVGPEGEIIRFRVDRYKSKGRQGEMRRVVRDSSDPAVGDTVLDLTLGAKAYKITKSGRKKVALNPEMIKKYRDSFLYHVRRVAAGKLSTKGFLEKVKALLATPRLKKSKRKLKKKRK
jgi:hypothetical protein